MLVCELRTLPNNAFYALGARVMSKSGSAFFYNSYLLFFPCLFFLKDKNVTTRMINIAVA